MKKTFPTLLITAFLALPTMAVASGNLPDGGTLSFLALGFTVGLGHALDADHIAAIATIMDKTKSRRGIIARGAAWGLGHTLALFVICSIVFLLGLTISSTTESALELAVGVMIAVLGLRVLWKLHRERIHIHAHEHDGTRHIHAHSHKGDPVRHDKIKHNHKHKARTLLPTLGIGLVHGAAGSAGLLVLIVATAGSTVEAIAAFMIFGVGSLIGMTVLTAAASYPLSRIHSGAAWMRTSLALTIGGLALLVSGSLITESLQNLGVVIF